MKTSALRKGLPFAGRTNLAVACHYLYLVAYDSFAPSPLNGCFEFRVFEDECPDIIAKPICMEVTLRCTTHEVVSMPITILYNQHPKPYLSSPTYTKRCLSTSQARCAASPAEAVYDGFILKCEAPVYAGYVG